MKIPSDPSEALQYARRYINQADLAQELGTTERTIRRWESGQTKVPRLVLAAIRLALARKEESNRKSAPFTFIDLFAGIGGMRKGFESQNGECVFTCEWDRFAAQTYAKNFGGDEIHGDIRQPGLIEKIPQHDVLVAGFPCQPFSLAGVSKKNSLGRAHGFADAAQGTLFFELAKIIQAKQPPAFLLENVKNLRSHDKGQTFEVIKQILTEELGYHITFKVIDARRWVPQHRERVFIVGFRDKETCGRFDWTGMLGPDTTPKLSDVLHDYQEEPETPYTEAQRGRCRASEKYTLSEHLWNYLQAYAAKHRAAGNGFGYSMVGPDDVARTLSARYHKDGSEILIRQKGPIPRRLTPRECARLMGFDSARTPEFEIPVSDTQAYRQFGNSVAVPVIKEIARMMVKAMSPLECAESGLSQ